MEESGLVCVDEQALHTARRLDPDPAKPDFFLHLYWQLEEKEVVVAEFCRHSDEETFLPAINSQDDYDKLCGAEESGLYCFMNRYYACRVKEITSMRVVS